MGRDWTERIFGPTRPEQIWRRVVHGFTDSFANCSSIEDAWTKQKRPIESVEMSIGVHCSKRHNKFSQITHSYKICGFKRINKLYPLLCLSASITNDLQNTWCIFLKAQLGRTTRNILLQRNSFGSRNRGNKETEGLLKYMRMEPTYSDWSLDDQKKQSSVAYNNTIHSHMTNH